MFIDRVSRGSRPPSRGQCGSWAGSLHHLHGPPDGEQIGSALSSINIALLAEGSLVPLDFYKHLPPDGEQIGSALSSLNIALLTDGGIVSLGVYEHLSLDGARIPPSIIYCAIGFTGAG
jgi:hypothetical protein